MTARDTHGEVDRDAGSQVRVQVLDGPHAGAVVIWERPGPYLVGRAAHAQLSLVHDLAASLEHCRVELNERGCLIEDLGSRQGTRVNGRPVTRSLLNSGDVVQVGTSEFSVTLVDPPERAATAVEG